MTVVLAVHRGVIRMDSDSAPAVPMISVMPAKARLVQDEHPSSVQRRAPLLQMLDAAQLKCDQRNKHGDPLARSRSFTARPALGQGCSRTKKRPSEVPVKVRSVK